MTGIQDLVWELELALYLPFACAFPSLVALFELVAPVLDVFEVHAQVVIVIVALFAISAALNAFMNVVHRFVFGSSSQTSDEKASLTTSDFSKHGRGSSAAYSALTRFFSSIKRLL